MKAIRPAVISDLSRMEAMGARFFAASGLDRWFNYKPHCFVQVCEKFMADDKAVLLVGEGQDGVVGMAGALAYPNWLDVSQLTAQERFWWVDPLHRGSLLGTELRKGLEGWARDKGCLTMQMGALETLRPDTLAKVYARKGYAPMEQTFCKRLT